MPFPGHPWKPLYQLSRAFAQREHALNELYVRAPLHVAGRLRLDGAAKKRAEAVVGLQVERLRLDREIGVRSCDEKGSRFSCTH